MGEGGFAETLTPEAYAGHVAARYGGAAPGCTEAIAEVARCELSALGQTLRWVLVQRVAKLLGAFGVTDEVAEEVVRSLEIAGDLSAGPGGEVACAPLRAVHVRAGRWLFAGTPLRERMGGPMAGIPRRLAAADDDLVRGAVAALGGRDLDLARWTGLDRTPTVRAWLDELETRLVMAERFADRTGALRWDEPEVFIVRRGWHSASLGSSAMLVRARQMGGWKAYAWARLVDGKTERVPLSWDEARCTMLAVGSVSGCTLTRAGGRLRDVRAVGAAARRGVPVAFGRGGDAARGAGGEDLGGRARRGGGDAVGSGGGAGGGGVR